ncbi:hypothetical protein MMAD_56800 (plasmid) [Mycolicibacterium madagascariense]|uniref:RNA polymerase sigma-70 region 4 domain-containing protein n=1 Tax=Mycolicibacterium madagascariense TaxID=212765 RepID=A0A7I7XQB9_9MYCO|nr:hypothetical protein [Mycolicibacterium madagascariense]BBZ31191.1 hypothetical protein MMAD_54860 [Mycolicibacterium madagascariense]BBZ31385.1 hypothetical protein MMAD_56800 [Mycolicibacterium madagascariense]
MDLIDDLHNPEWWRDPALLSTRLGDLVPNFDTIGSFTIPYTRLPRRLGSYAEEFPRWADVADQTPESLMLRPKLGEAAVRALIEAAEHAVRVRRDTIAAGRVGADAAVARLVGELDDSDRKILAGQVWAADPVPQRVLAERLGVNPVSVSRNLPRARARFAELLSDPAHHEVGEHAERIRQRLGPYVPVDVAELELLRLNVDPTSQTAAVLLDIAGPYVSRGGWMDAGGSHAQVLAAVEAVFDGQGAPTTDALLDALTSRGLSTGVALTFLETKLTLRRFGDAWVRWAGDTTLHMVEAALHLLGAPATAEALHAVIERCDSSGVSVDRIKAVLSQKERFIRTSRTTWGLRRWGVVEYVNIAHAIGECIDASGGKAAVATVFNDLRARYPDISESSIRTYLGTLAFVQGKGVVRRRTKADAWPALPPLNTIRGVFRNGPDEIRVAHLVTAEVLRGSGQVLHSAVADAVGVRPGEQRTFTSSQGPVTVYWKLASTGGAAIGSLRAHAQATGATAGDTLVLVFKLDDSKLEAARIGADESAAVQLPKLVGHPVRAPSAALTTALSCPPQDVGAVLRARGDNALADLLDAP